MNRHHRTALGSRRAALAPHHLPALARPPSPGLRAIDEDSTFELDRGGAEPELHHWHPWVTTASDALARDHARVGTNRSGC